MQHYIFNTSDIEAQVLDAMDRAGCKPVDGPPLELDAQIHRYRVQGDKRGSKNGAYCIFTDHWPAGWFCNWRTGILRTWSFPREHLDKEGSDYFTSERYKEALRLSEEHQKQLRAELQAKQEQATLDAQRIWNGINTFPAPNFPYLKAKHVASYGLKLRTDFNAIMYGGDREGQLVIPLRSIDGQIQTLQYIDSHGDKRFHTGAPTKGAFWSVSLDEAYMNASPEAPILIAEGYATAATIYECTSLPTVAAMNANNLFPVAEAIKAKYPGRKLLIMADNDRHKDGTNPGMDKATEAVAKLGLQGMISPKFEDYEEGSDWNDYVALHGFDEASSFLHEQISLELRPPRIKDIAKYVETINAQALRNMELPPIKWAVEGFLPSGLTILGGGPKVGKSFLALHLAIGVAIGGCVLGKINVERGNVLYLALEDNKRRLQERLGSSSILPEGSDVSRLELITTIPRQHEGGLEYVSWWLEAHPEARLVIIDTLQMFRKQLSGKTGVYGEDYDAVAELKRLADQRDVAILILHHLKKVSAKEDMFGDWINQFSGSMGLSGSADTLFVLKRERTSQSGILHRTGRDVEEKDFRMRLDSFGWVLEGEAEDFTLPTWKKQILDYLKEHESVTPMELSDVFSLSIEAAKKNLQRMSKEGLVRRTGHGKYSL